MNLKMYMQVNFFTKLMIVVLFITLTSTAVTGLTLLSSMETQLKASITQEVQGKSVDLANNIERMIQEKVKTGQMIAGNAQVMRGDVKGIQEILEATYKGDPTAYAAIGILNKDGIVTHSVPSGTTVGTSLADRPYFKQTMQTGQPVCNNDIIIARDKNGTSMYTIVCPIKDAAGTPSGAVVQYISLNMMEQLRAQVKIGETGNIAVYHNVNGKALPVAHWDQNAVAEKQDFSGVEIVKVTMGGQEETMHFKDSSGENVFGTSSIVNTTKWMVVATMPEKEMYAPIVANRYKVLMILGLTVLAVIVITWIFSRRIAGRLSNMVERVTQVANGDLTGKNIEDTSADEIGQLGRALTAMSNQLRTLIQHVMQSVEHVSASSAQLKTGAEQSAQGASQVAESIAEVASGTERQTNAVHKTTVVINRISDQIKQVATDVAYVKTTSDHAADIAKNGNGAIDAAVNQMNTIEEKVVNSAQIVVSLGERSKEVGQIVDTIAGIAGQTNLLALNAAIEAARAGEQGRGFAVVAEEVRKLAEQSQNAAKEIADLISEIQNDTDSAVVAMNEGTSEVKTGTEVVAAAGQAFKEIVAAVEQVSAQVQKISGAIQTVADSSQEIVAAAQEIDIISKETTGQTQTVSAVTEEQSASMEEIAAASNSLAEMAKKLQQAVAKFKVDA